MKLIWFEMNWKKHDKSKYECKCNEKLWMKEMQTKHNISAIRAVQCKKMSANNRPHAENCLNSS